MAFRSEQARVLNRRLVGRLVRNLVVFTCVLGLICFAYQRFLNAEVANAVAERTAPWHTLDSSTAFNDILVEEGYFDEPVFWTESEYLGSEGYGTDPGSGAELTPEDLASLFINRGTFAYLLDTGFFESGSNPSLTLDSVGDAANGEDVDEDESGTTAVVDGTASAAGSASATDDASDKGAGQKDADGGNGVYIANGVMLGEWPEGNYSDKEDGDVDFDTRMGERLTKERQLRDELSIKGAASATLNLKDSFNENGIPYNIDAVDILLYPDQYEEFVTYLATTQTPTAIMDSVKLVRDEASVAEVMSAYIFAIIIDGMDLRVELPIWIDTDVIGIKMVQAFYGGTQQSLNEVMNTVFDASQQRTFEQIEGLPRGEMQHALRLDNPNFELEVQRDGLGVYRYRDVATYNLIKSFKIPLVVVVFVAGWLIIVARTLTKSLRYFDELSGAVASLLADRDAPIVLPKDLSIAQNELGVIRAQSIADERAAKAAEQRKNELVAYLAHDIRTPLTSVLGYLDLLRETTELPADTQRKYSDIAYNKAERLQDLINEFFEITRYNLSAIPIERETVGVKLFCEQIAESFYPDALARSVDISISTRSVDKFFVDPDKLARAVGNIMRNALSYAEPHSVIKLSAQNNDRTTVISITNRGREISAAHLETIFEKFYREDGSRSSRSGGAGLGLAIAREIVTAHDGTVYATSEEGVTTFTIEIPHRQGTSGAHRAPAHTSGSGALPVIEAEPSVDPAALRSSAPRTTPTRRVPRHGRQQDRPASSQSSRSTRRQQAARPDAQGRRSPSEGGRRG